MKQDSSSRITRPSDGVLVIKQDYQFLLNSESPYFGAPFSPLSSIVITFYNTSSQNTKMEIVVENYDVYFIVVSSSKGQKVEKQFKTTPEMGHLLPKDVKDATWALQHQFWIRLNKTTNSVGFYVGDYTPYTKALFEEKINPWDLPKKQLQRYPGVQAGQVTQQNVGQVGRFEFEFNMLNISFFEGKHTTSQPTWVKWHLYENNAKPISPVVKEPGNFYGSGESVPLVDYPHGIQHLYSLTKNKNLRDLAFLMKSSKINESWEDVPSAIHYSILTKQGKQWNGMPVGILNHLFRLKNHWEFKELQTEGRSPEDIMKEITETRRAYIRFQTLAPDGDAPGSKMVLEIWPPHCCSIIHNHGEAFGVVKPLAGSIRVQNFHRLGFGSENPFAEFTYHAGSFTWMSEHSYGVHRLINSFKQTCITIQSYLNGENTTGTFSVVGKGKFAFGEDDFLGQYTPQNDWQNYIKGLTSETAEDKKFIADVIEAYGIKETGSIDFSFRKFCNVMRAEYENLNNMFNKIKYISPSAKDTAASLFGKEEPVPKLRVADEKEKEVTGSTYSGGTSQFESDRKIEKVGNGTTISEIEALVKNKLIEQAGKELIKNTEIPSAEVRHMIKNLRRTGHGELVAQLAYYIWKNGDDRYVYKNFNFDQDDRVEFMKLGSDNKKAWLYLGDIKDGRKHGKGVLIWSFKAEYKGDFRNDMREGHGVYKHHDGARYDGEWAKDMKNGKGVLDYPQSNERYEGEFKNNDRHGKGSYTYSDGTRYVGEWKYDLKDGKGIYFMENKDRYEGTWEKDVLHGKGVLIQANGQKRPKEYNHGKKA